MKNESLQDLSVGDLLCLFVISGQKLFGVVLSIAKLEETRFVGGSVIPVRRREKLRLLTERGVVSLNTAMIFTFKRL